MDKEQIEEIEKIDYIEIELMAYKSENEKRLQISKLFNPSGMDRLRLSITDGTKVLEFVDLETDSASEAASIIEMVAHDSITQKLEIMESNIFSTIRKEFDKDVK